jgi:hypothetical protein
MTQRKQILAAILLTFVLPIASFGHEVPPAQGDLAEPALFVVTVGGKDGFINGDGKIVIKPAFEKAYPFSDGLAAVQKAGVWGFIDADGRVVIEPRFVMVGLFSDGLARFRDKRFTDPWGYIDRKGEWVLPPRYQHANDFSEGLAGVSLGEEGWGFIDRTGKVVIPAKSAWVYEGFRRGIVGVAFDGKLGYINTKGEWLWRPSE